MVHLCSAMMARKKAMRLRTNTTTISSVEAIIAIVIDFRREVKSVQCLRYSNSGRWTCPLCYALDWNIQFNIFCFLTSEAEKLHSMNLLLYMVSMAVMILLSFTLYIEGNVAAVMWRSLTL
ncbi:unnamed protein product [Linum trigynum]|uniref:Uncharacterized protein n=1 Tax=Linum trigynum TaxID=586398 RepID=A0AAV2F9D0_9ROSI